MDGTTFKALLKKLPESYNIEGPLGKGGQGSVFKGSVDGTPCAIKAFMPSTDIRRVEREISALQRISCPNLVHVVSSLTVEVSSIEIAVVAYEFHPHGDLTSWLSDDRPLPAPTEVAALGIQIGRALDSLWAHRIVHRDVKPANIVRATDGRYVLVDLGLARHLDRSDVSAQGARPGTPGYMSPEQGSGRRNLTVHSDAFSLGVSLRYLATKIHPFAGQQARIQQRLVPRQTRDVRQELGDSLCRTIDRLMSFRPSLRPAALADAFYMAGGQDVPA